MNQYALQSYFENICKVFYVAYKEVRRLEKEEEDKQFCERKCEEHNIQKRYWKSKCNDLLVQINSIATASIESHMTFIITTKEEIYSLLAFFKHYSLRKNPIINTGEDYLKSFPKGEQMYKEFLKAYMSNNAEEMDELYHMYF